MESEQQIHALRLQRLRRSFLGLETVESIALCPDLVHRSWVALTCSRLGTGNRLQSEVCGFLARSMLDCRSRNAVCLVAEGSAIQPWALRAAELFGIDVVLLNADGNASDDDLPRIICRCRDEGISRDAAVIAMADRVDAAYVRPNGTIAECLRDRLAERCDASTRVAVIHSRKSAARELIDAGAIGWFVHRRSTDSDPRQVTDSSDGQIQNDPSWTRTDGVWLVHCTRACTGAWPGQTIQQHRDSMLLNSRDENERTPFDTLKRILASSRLIAGAIASDRRWPVVCFSAAPLCELLSERCFRAHLKRWDYEPYGIALRRTVAIDLGIKPVIYGEPVQRDHVQPDDQFRFQATGTTYDWRREREWRSAHDVDLSTLVPGDLRVFVASQHEARMLTGQFDCTVDVVTLPDQQRKGSKRSRSVTR